MKINVRFFIYDEEALDDYTGEPGDVIEVNEEAFLECPFPISYERHTVWANGVDQVCLTKMPED